jgi:hypothetical protein
VDSETQSRSRYQKEIRDTWTKLTRWILQVGARIRDDALSFASGANSLYPTSLIRSVSQVAAKAVAHYVACLVSSESQKMYYYSSPRVNPHRKALCRSAHEEMAATDTFSLQKARSSDSEWPTSRQTVPHTIRPIAHLFCCQLEDDINAEGVLL